MAPLQMCCGPAEGSPKIQETRAEILLPGCKQGLAPGFPPLEKAAVGPGGRLETRLSQLFILDCPTAAGRHLTMEKCVSGH